MNNINIEKISYLSSNIIERLNEPTPFNNQSSVNYEDFLKKEKHKPISQLKEEFSHIESKESKTNE